MLCPMCNTNNRENAKFCKGCGQVLFVETKAGSKTVVGSGQKTAITPDDTSEQSSHPVEISGPSLPLSTPAPGSSKEEPEVPAETAAPPPPPPEEEVVEEENTPSLVSSSSPYEANPYAPVPEASADNIEAVEDDPDLAPTQILTPEEIEALRLRRQQQVSRSSGESHQEKQDEEDSLATPIVTSDVEPRGDQEEETDISLIDTEETKVDEPVLEEDPTTVPELDKVDEEDHETDELVEGGAAEEQQEGSDTMLEVGTLIGDRYEVTQVVTNDEDERLYEVVDRKGYLRCWSCGSDQNTKEDDFCSDCGAELTNPKYQMREYLAGQTSNDAAVLQAAIVDTIIDNGNTYVIELPMEQQSPFPDGVHILASSASDAGMTRRGKPNEDSTLVLLLERVHESISGPVGIFLVADGMGGHANGQLASRMTTGIIAERITSELLMPPLELEKKGEVPEKVSEEQLMSVLQHAIEEANTRICKHNQSEKSDMGSTLTGFMIVGEYAYIFNVGDSRTYMLRDGKLYQLTNDHSLVGQLVAGGLIAPEDVYTHPQRTQIYRSIGDKLNVQIDVFKQRVHPGDILLSCSDGLWEMIRDPQITEILNVVSDPQTVCQQLIDTANANGGEDNVSAVVAYIR